MGVKKVILLIMILLLFVIALFLMQTEHAHQNSKIQVRVSTFALYDIVKAVGGKAVDVEMVIPFGVEVHSFEPTPKTIIDIKKSKLFLYSGASLEPWVKKLSSSKNMRDMSVYVTLRDAKNDDVNQEEHTHHHEAVDPHYWLDVDNMKRLTKKIVSMLSKEDGADAQLFKVNGEKYLEMLSKLDVSYRKGLNDCKQHKVVLHHNILGYVASRYGFSVETLSGLSPDAMADAKTMAKLSKTIKEEQLKVLFYEAFVSDKLMQSLAKEHHIKVEFLEPLANITALQAKEGMRYVDGMERNLEKLSEAMECR